VVKDEIPVVWVVVHERVCITFELRARTFFDQVAHERGEEGGTGKWDSRIEVDSKNKRPCWPKELQRDAFDFINKPHGNKQQTLNLRMRGSEERFPWRSIHLEAATKYIGFGLVDLPAIV
jgi:hypothetical protein